MIQALAIGSFFKNNKKAIIYTLVGIVVVYLLYKLWTRLRGSDRTEVTLVSPLEGGTVAPNFDPKPYADEFEKEFIGWQFEYYDRNNLLERMYTQLSDNEMIILHNYWNDNYSRRTNWFSEYGSMYEVLTGEIYPPLTTGDTINYFPLTEERLQRLNLL